jgi:NitT/TauT family transport system ATP-binding protein
MTDAVPAPNPPDPEPTALLRCVGVDKRFPGGRVALAGLDLAVREGEFVSLLGPSGCGKSTALRLLGGLDEPSAGVVERAPAASGRAPGFVFQDAALMPWATVRRNVELPLRLQGLPAAAREVRVDEALAKVGLVDAADAVPRELSGGMRMRASLARALVTDPRLWLLDEPFGALDEITRFALNQTLLALCQPGEDATPATAVFVTHSVYEAVFLSHRILVMARPGRVVEEIVVDAPFPRDTAFRATAGFAARCVEVSAALQRASDMSTGGLAAAASTRATHAVGAGR